MADISRKQATIIGLESCGHIEELGRSRKYRCFREDVPTGVPARTFLVGKSGALRVITAGHSAISDSISRTDTKQHAAFAYVGRVVNATGQGKLMHHQCKAIYDAVIRKEIPVTREGFHAESK